MNNIFDEFESILYVGNNQSDTGLVKYILSRDNVDFFNDDETSASFLLDDFDIITKDKYYDLIVIDKINNNKEYLHRVMSIGIPFVLLLQEVFILWSMINDMGFQRAIHTYHKDLQMGFIHFLDDNNQRYFTPAMSSAVFDRDFFFEIIR